MRATRQVLVNGAFLVHLFALPEQKSSSTESTPDDLEEEELLEYAAQYATLADFTDLELTADNWAVLTDLDDLDTPRDGSYQTSRRGMCETSDMDMS